MPTSTRRDPYAACNFRVELDGIAVAGFEEVSGLSSETSVIEYREGTDRPMTTRKIPGLTKYPNITLKYGITDGKELWSWRKSVIDGATVRRTGAIVLQNEGGTDVRRWIFRGGWPSKWIGPTLRARSNEVAIETLEICHEGLDLDE